MHLSAALHFLAQATTAAPAAAGTPAGAAGAAAGTAGQASQGGFPIIIYALFIAALYFLFFAPQRKQKKEHEKLISSVEPGDEILTTGGIYGVVTSVKDDRLTVRISEGAKVEIGKHFITAVTRKAADKK